jgi:hypothetical protein
VAGPAGTLTGRHVEPIAARGRLGEVLGQRASEERSTGMGKWWKDDEDVDLTIVGVGQVGGKVGNTVVQSGGDTYVNGQKVGSGGGSIDIIDGEVYVDGKRVG